MKSETCEQESLDDLIDHLRQQKIDLAQERHQRTQRVVARHRAKLAALNKDNYAQHPAKWNSSANVSWFNKVHIVAGEPVPNGKFFDMDGRSIWPAMKRVSEVSDDDERYLNLKPWLSVRNGEFFEAVKPLGSGSPSKYGSTLDDNDEDLDQGSRKTSSVKVIRAMHPRPWLIPSCAPGTLFSKYA